MLLQVWVLVSGWYTYWLDSARRLMHHIDLPITLPAMQYPMTIRILLGLLLLLLSVSAVGAHPIGRAKADSLLQMPSYVHELGAYLRDSYSLSSFISFRVSVKNIELDVTQVVPLGLIINEAITNACKYTFSLGRSGTISRSLLRVGEAIYQLAIADNGAGLPANYNPMRSRLLGMTLMQGFSGQLVKVLTITSSPGVTLELMFEKDQLSPTYTRADYAY